MSPETFAARFKEAREKKNITIKALQPLVGASPSAMNGYATGKTLPPLDVASKIAQELGVSLDWLCGIEKDEGKASIDNCADAAVALETVRDMFNRSSITVVASDKSAIDEYGEPVTWREHFTQLTIDSKTLYSYFKQLEATDSYYHSLPAEAQAGFEPFRISMRDSLLTHMRGIKGKETGLKSAMHLVIDGEELPF